MRLHHIAVWVSNLDEAAAFWQTYFAASVEDIYESKRQIGFRSRFAVLTDAQLRIELMTKPGLAATQSHLGWAHIALSLGSDEAVNEAAGRFAADQRLVLGPRKTGDGFYEAVVLGPDGLEIELTS